MTLGLNLRASGAHDPKFTLLSVKWCRDYLQTKACCILERDMIAYIKRISMILS